MKKIHLVLFTLLLTIPAAARVLSYAPYNKGISRSGFQERTTRWFLLAEEARWSMEIVLHDSRGVQEPRVVVDDWDVGTPLALYEHKGQPDAPPILLVGQQLSLDGGSTWKELQADSESKLMLAKPRDFDTGGPFVHGLSAAILPATDDTPFLICDEESDIYAVRATGELVLLRRDATLVGRNAAGDQFLIHEDDELSIMNLDGEVEFLRGVPRTGDYTGWIAGDGTIFLVSASREGRALQYWSGSRRDPFIAGPRPGLPVEQNSLGLPGMSSFAIPTSDFNGAWIVQRNPGHPTTLLRFTPERGLETMWSDPSGPEIEALIAGASGKKLLVQVHRDRPGMDVPDNRFIPTDPALAVWTVDGPMPTEYHELFLAEEWNKGFIHVDVDRMEAGEPFVFDGGVYEEDVDVIFSAGGGGDIIQEWGAVRASFRQHLVLPGVARNRGAFDSQWFTDVTILNPLDTVQDVELRFAATGEDDAATPLAGRTMTIALAPREIRVLDDVLRNFGVENGGGALHVLPANEVNVTGRTYSRNTRGTFGFGMYAVDFYNAAGARFPLTFGGAFPGPQFRTNVLLTDTSGRGVEAALRSRAGSIMVQGAETVITPPNATMQFNGIAVVPEGPVAAARNDGGLIIETRRGTTIPMVVAIDNRTNDPSYVAPDVSSEAPRIIPVIGHLDGAHGSRFRTDLYVLNTRSGKQGVELEVIPWGSTVGRSIYLALLTGESFVIPDVLDTLFGMSGIARLRYWSWESDTGKNAGVTVTSRTYAVDADGATYGCLIPGMNAFHRAMIGEQVEILATAGEGFRTNLGIVNVADADKLTPSTGRIDIYGEAGELLLQRTIELNGQVGIPINDILATAVGPSPRAVRIVLSVLSGGPLAAYATVVDNATNDTTYYPGQLSSKTN